ncbi:uncharacterized protein CTRU02_211176 [Colletotrichum truncatum]|uniref:Uncharacterized protein n=1 Tax=Colletotrichum truncatum TaxID=5467 RepID=A0ACC3YR92_COLTU|nr:uncharacterized protein CTRU02_01957 [Colletotrichum truncatum]KAF6799086.1 hypothetical protein CTRU02_01957 [Colletotrichum truncatum]
MRFVSHPFKIGSFPSLFCCPLFFGLSLLHLSPSKPSSSNTPRVIRCHSFRTGNKKKQKPLYFSNISSVHELTTTPFLTTNHNNKRKTANQSFKMQLTNTLVVLSAALSAGVSAHPSLHGHQHFHERRADVDERDLTFIKNKAPVPSPSVVSSSSSAAPSATPTTAATGEYIPFCSGKSKRATLDQIAYSGNTGAEGSWGCNMQIIDESIKSLYNYTTTFTSSQDTYTCSCFNKIGPKGLIDGCWFAAITFSVKEGQSKHVAFEADSQGSCACGPGSDVPKTFIGQFAGTWLEFDWGSTPNGGNSGADASVLVAGATGMKYYGMKVAANGKTCSWVKSDGSNEGAYMPGMEAEDGVGCKGYHTGHLDVTLGDKFTA